MQQHEKMLDPSAGLAAVTRVTEGEGRSVAEQSRAEQRKVIRRRLQVVQVQVGAGRLGFDRGWRSYTTS